MNVADALADVARGAGAGMALGPIGAVAGGVGGLVLDLAPEIGKSLFGVNGAQTATDVAKAVETTSGTSDAAAATQKLQTDTAAAAELRIKLAQIAAARQAEEDSARNAQLAANIANTADARGHTVRLAQLGSSLAWGAPVISLVVVIAFFVVLMVIALRGIPPGAETILNVMLGFLGSAFGAVVGYWVGSSSGSAQKTEVLGNLAAQAQPIPASTSITTTPPPHPSTTITSTGGTAPVAPVPFSQGPAPLGPPLSFDAAFEGVIGVEGGYVNNPSDPGGETKYGISKRAFPNEDIKNLTLERAKELYRQEYWTPLKTDQMPAPLAFELFDFAVNSGPRTAVTCLQELVGAKQDGSVGPQTLLCIAHAVQTTSATAVCRDYMAARMRYLRSLPTWHTFERGWTARLATVESKAQVV